jgi:type IV secretion system protein VirB10
MRISAILTLLSLSLSGLAIAQQGPDGLPDGTPRLSQRPVESRPVRPHTLGEEWVVPSGTKIPVVLKHAISTKSAKPGDPVYAQTTFPVVIDEKVMIPAGTYVQGTISQVTRPGRVKGRAELLFHFTTLIYPNGYTVMLPGAVDQIPGQEHSKIKDQEGTVQQEGEKGKDAKTVATAAGTGAAIGAVTEGGLKGAAIGAAGGSAVGTAIALLSRGSDLKIEQGTAVDMVLHRDVTLNSDRVMQAANTFAPQTPSLPRY